MEIVKMFTTVLTLVAACLAAPSCNPEMDDLAPASGAYRSVTGDLYRIDTTGPTALAVSGPDGLCLQFWRSKEPTLIDGVELLRGQECENRNRDDMRWSLAYAPSKRDSLTIYRPDFPGGAESSAIQLTYAP